MADSDGFGKRNGGHSSRGLSAEGFANLANIGQADNRQELEAMGRAAMAGISDADKGSIPSTIRNQNLGHNSKKAGLGPNTKRG